MGDLRSFIHIRIIRGNVFYYFFLSISELCISFVFVLGFLDQFYDEIKITCYSIILTMQCFLHFMYFGDKFAESKELD